jgi:hypothetical protein
LGVTRGFAIIVASGISFAAGGLAVGYAIARFAPSYYRSVFRGGKSPDFDPVQVGLGLGLTQGLIAGLIVGAVVVLAASIFGLRRSEKGRLHFDDEVGQHPIKGGLIKLVVFLIGSALTLPVGLIVGSLRGDYACKERRFADEKAIIAPVLSSDPSMSSIKIEMFTGDGTAELSGEVATQEDLDRLQSRMKTLMGEARNKQFLDGVSVRKK